MNSIDAEVFHRRATLYVSLTVLVSTTTSLAVRSGYSYGLVMLLPAACLLWTHRPALNLKRSDFLLMGSLSFYFLIHVLAALVHRLSSASLDKPSRFILAIPILLLLLAWPPRQVFCWAGLALGAIGGGLRAFWEELTGVQGYMNPIQFGNISLLLGVLCLAGVGWAQAQRHAARWSALMMTGACAGLAGSFLSGSRGGWIALPLVLVISCRTHRRIFIRSHVVPGMMIIASLCAGFYAVSETGVRSRVGEAVDEVKAYYHAGNAHTSVGVRLEMWRTGLHLVWEHPFMGWGERNYIEPMLRNIQDEMAKPIIHSFNHIHNEYLDALVKRGFVGLTALLLIYLIPLAHFTSRIRNDHPSVRVWALAGTLLVLCCMTFGLSQAFLAHNSGVTVYTFFLVVIWACLRHEEQGHSVEKPEQRQE